MIVENNKYNEINTTLKQDLLSSIAINKLFTPDKIVDDAVRWDGLQLEIADINNFIDGNEVHLYFTRNTIHDSVVMQEPDDNANGKVTTFISPMDGVYRFNCYVRIIISFSVTPPSDGANYDGILYSYKNGTKYSFVEVQKMIINRITEAPNIQQTKFDLLITDIIALKKYDKLNFGIEWNQGFFTSSDVHTYEVYGNFSANIINRKYNQLNAASIAVFPI